MSLLCVFVMIQVRQLQGSLDQYQQAYKELDDNKKELVGFHALRAYVLVCAVYINDLCRKQSWRRWLNSCKRARE